MGGWAWVQGIWLIVKISVVKISVIRNNIGPEPIIVNTSMRYGNIGWLF